MVYENMDNFNNVDHKPLRVFNRLVMFSNILEDKGKEFARHYMEQFSPTDRKEMYLIRKLIDAKGVDAVRELVTKDAVFDYDPSEDIEYGI